MLAALSYRVTSECGKTNGRDRIGDSMVIKCVCAGPYQAKEEVNMKLYRSECIFSSCVPPSRAALNVKATHRGLGYPSAYFLFLVSSSDRNSTQHVRISELTNL